MKKELTTPPSALEVANVLSALAGPRFADCHDIVRRLAFERDRLVKENTELRDRLTRHRNPKDRIE